MTIPDRYPPAAWRPVTYIGEAGALVLPPMGWVLHVQDGNNDPGPMFSAATSPKRRFSHLWFSKDGHVSQYQSLTRESWAQGTGGNPRWWSCETEGFPGEPLTDAQLDALAAWHVWCGAPDVVTSNPAVSGIGTHSMGGASWGNHPGCPGPIRAGQRADILRRAALLRGGDMPLTDDEVNRIATAVLAKLAGWRPPVPENEPAAGGPGLNWQTMISRDHTAIAQIQAQQAAAPKA